MSEFVTGILAGIASAVLFVFGVGVAFGFFISERFRKTDV